MGKRVLKSFLFLYLPVLALSLLFFYIQKQNQLKKLALIEERSITYKKNLFISLCSSLVHDINYWANIGYPIDFEPMEKHAQMMIPYLDLINGIRDYDQFRFIGLDGKEFYRVVQRGRLGIAQDELQDKKDRDYVTEGLKLRKGQVYLSQIDLNIENGIVERPFKPVIRAVAPIYNINDEKIGLVVLNFKMSRILTQLRSQISDENFYLLDSDFHIITTTQFEEELPQERILFGELDSILLPQLPSKELEIGKDTTFTSNKGLWTLAHLDLSKQRTLINPYSYELIDIKTPTSWSLIQEIPDTGLQQNLLPIYTGLGVFNLFALLLLLAMSYLYHRSTLQKKLFYQELEDKNERLNNKRKQLEEKNKFIIKMNHKLSIKNKQLSEFNYLVSHNLRSPVSSMSVVVDILKKEKENPKRVEELLPKLNQVSDSIIEFTKDISEYSTILDRKDIKMEQVELVPLIESIKNEFTETLLDTKEFEVVINSTGWETVYFSRFYLKSIIQNLISNAIKYKRNGVPSFIEFETTIEEDKKVLYVRDNGMGIDLDKHGKNLFGLYKRFHRNISGKGMGLFLVKSQLQSLDATISVESKVKEGTIFKIIFTNHEKDEHITGRR